MPIKEVRHLPDRECMEYVAYYAWMAGFNILSEMFLSQLCCILLKHYEACNTIYDIIQNPVLHEVQSLCDKNPWFVSYVTKSARDLAQVEIKSVSSSNQLKMPVEDMNLQRLRILLLVAIDRAVKGANLVAYTNSYEAGMLSVNGRSLVTCGVTWTELKLNVENALINESQYMSKRRSQFLVRLKAIENTMGFSLLLFF